MRKSRKEALGSSKQLAQKRGNRVPKEVQDARGTEGPGGGKSHRVGLSLGMQEEVGLCHKGNG